MTTSRRMMTSLWLLFWAASTRAFVVVHRRRVVSSVLQATTFTNTVQVGECLGSGSYGTVHLLNLKNNWCVGKRAWTVSELSEQWPDLDATQIQEKADRCQAYIQTEKASLEQLKGQPGITPFRGTIVDETGLVWLLFDICYRTKTATATPSRQDIAPTLQDVLEQQPHSLRHVSKALGLDVTDTGAFTTSDNDIQLLTETLDVVMLHLLQILATLHQAKIVHRDVKPGNLLVTRNQKLVLIDFGSAACLSGLFWGLEERVAISPIYAAPEVFIDPNSSGSALTFDCFSAGLLFCQLLFQLTDERTESGFHQQLNAADCQLDVWLATQLQAKVRPAGLNAALQVLRNRPGLWRLLQQLLQKRPSLRISSVDALETFEQILHNAKNKGAVADDRIFNDGLYLKEVWEATDSCFISPPVRPLHFVATFERKQPLGLILAEADAEHDDEMDNTVKLSWQQATQDATPGQVFVQGIVPGSQAEEMNIFEIGDCLQGIGELPLAEGGFERAVELLQDQPRNAKFVTLHFDRKSQKRDPQLPVIFEGPIQVLDQGAWSSKGLRQAQEDAFLLHDVHDTKERSILLAGVMDGHLGRAASHFVKQELPIAFSDELLQTDQVPTEDILLGAWDQTCLTYQNSCVSGDECVADYDPREGLLMANTGSVDSISGTTAVLLALDKQTSHLAFLNCGDSRGLIVNANGQVDFSTVDHTPETDAERLVEGRKQGLDYSEPTCGVAKWTIEVGEYDYAVARSLEGPFATSKGIVATPDVSVFQAEPSTTVVLATDGLWAVYDSVQVGQIVAKLRQQSVNAGDAAKTLCSMALEKGSSDNVSAVIVYLE